MLDAIRRLFCKHDFKEEKFCEPEGFVRRTQYYLCEKCGKIKTIRRLP